MKLTATDFSNVKDPDELTRFIAIFKDETNRILNSGIIFVDNFNSKILSVTFAAANTDTQVTHNLGRAPGGYLVFKLDAPLIVYDGVQPTTDSSIFLRASATGTATIMLF